MEKYTTTIEFVKESRRYRSNIRNEDTNEIVHVTQECSNAETALKLAQQYLSTLSNTIKEKQKTTFTPPQKPINFNNTTTSCCRR